MKQEYKKTSIFINGLLLGFAVSTLIWCTLWAYALGKLDDVHKKELKYLIELHQKELKKH